MDAKEKDSKKDSEDEEPYDKLASKISQFFASECGLSVGLAHEVFESSSTLSESLSSFSSNQYFTQETAKKWFDLSLRAGIIHFRAEETGARLAYIASKAEIAISKKQKPAVDMAQTAKIAKDCDEMVLEIAECNSQAQALLSELRREVGAR